jgi:uncharacterized protein YjdB
MYRAVCLLVATAVMSACDKVGTLGPDIEPVDTTLVASVHLSPASDTLLALGDTVRFTAVVTNVLGHPITGKTVVWSSSDTNTATIDPSTGLATAKGTGSVSIRASVDVVHGTAVLSVIQEVATVVVTPANDTIAGIDSTLQFTAEASDANDNPVSDVVFIWLSSNHNVAVIDTSGLAIAVGEGAAIITAAARGIPGNAIVTVTNPVRSVVLEPESVTLEIGDTVRLAVATFDGRGHTLTDRNVAWSSSNEAVATVDTSGSVEGVSVGSITVNATSEGVSDSCSVTVVDPVISIAEARSAPVGDTVHVDGIVLNFFAAYGDSTVHISDNTGAIRAIRIRPITVFPGDSVRFVGKVAAFDGQPVIDDPTVFLLGFSRVPPPEVVSTFEANAARAGTLDAALVSVANARITDTATVAGFNRIPYVPGTVLNVTGLLVPDGSGSWVLKPRGPGDVTVQ